MEGRESESSTDLDSIIEKAVAITSGESIMKLPTVGAEMTTRGDVEEEMAAV